MSSYLIMMMGGSGTRLGADRPKQYIEVEGKPVFGYIIEAYDKTSCIDEMVIVSNKDWLDYVEEWVGRLGIKKRVTITEGGETRSHSVYNGLKAIKDRAKDDDIVLFHDATHPYVDEAGTEGVIEAIKKYGGATLGEFQYDTVYRMTDDGFIDKVIPRQEVVAGASPEGFTFGNIFRIYDNASDDELKAMTSAGAIAKEHNIQMKIVQASVINLKITYPVDMEAFKKIVKSYFFE